MRLRGIEKRFGATVALAGVDLDVAPGEVHALIGENGAGKSTLLNIVSGLIAPDAGQIEIGGRASRPPAPGILPGAARSGGTPDRGGRDARPPEVAYIHQELLLCPHLSVAENILLGREPSHRGWLRRDAMHERARQLLAGLGRSEIDPRTRTGTLSLADQQIVEICRALATDAQLILMDEPTSSLQRADVERLFTLIRQLRARGIAIVYVSHFLEEVREIADRFTVLRDGRSIVSGALSEVTNDELIRAMVAVIPSGVDPSTHASNDTQRMPRPLIRLRHLLPRGEKGLDSGFGFESSIPAEHEISIPGLESRAFSPSGEKVPKADEGAVAYPHHRRLRRSHARDDSEIALSVDTPHAHFDLHRGEILGIAGLIGSGRTRLIRSIANRKTGYLSEDRKGEGLALQLSIADNVTICRFPARFGWIDLDAQAEQTRTLIERLRIKAAGPHVRTFALSGGNQQKVALARLLHQDADVLLLDEPARGIDVGSKADIYREIALLAAAGKAIVVVSSYLPELFAICDRIAVMRRGRLGEPRPTSEWTPDAIMQAAIGGSEAA